MRKKILSVLVTVTLLAGTIPAHAQMFGHDSEVDRLVRSNQRMVNRFSYGGGHGHYYDHHGYYGHGRRRGGSSDAWIGLGLGAVAGALVYGVLNNRDNQTPPPPPPSYGNSVRPYDNNSVRREENGWNSRLRQQGGDNPYWPRRKCDGFRLKNETGETIRVYKDGEPYVVVRPGRAGCGDPFAEYTAEALPAVSDGYTARAHIVRAKPEGQSGGVWVWR